jgi:methionine synthase II (cobalamin-independent)
MITAHTDVVGSLLRPVALRKARDDWVAGRLSHAQFKSIEDRAVDEESGVVIETNSTAAKRLMETEFARGLARANDRFCRSCFCMMIKIKEKRGCR